MLEASEREKIARIEGIVEQMDKRISEFREDFNTRLKDFNDRFHNIEMELRDLRNRIWWVIGIQITMWITIILTIIFK